MVNYAGLLFLFFVTEKMVHQNGEFTVITIDRENNSWSVMTQTHQEKLQQKLVS